MPLILDVKDLTISFINDHRSIPAVENLSFSLQAGEVLGIVGESGSGKSTTALALMKLLPRTAKTSGIVEFHPSPQEAITNLIDQSEAEMENVRGSKIAMIFQDPLNSLNPVHRCGDQIIEAIQLHEKVSHEAAHRRALALFEEVKLPSPKAIMTRYPWELSGGQIQRVMIAMALSCNPAILIADEPTTALDVTIQATILQLLREIRDRRRMSILFITHDLGVVAEIADAIAVLYRGQLVEYGPVDEIFRYPQHPYTKGLIACRPNPDLQLKFLPTVADFMESAVNPDGITQLQERQTPSSITMQAVTPVEQQARLQQLQKQTPVLEVQNLRVYFPIKGPLGRVNRYFQAVDDVSFTVYPGETLGLVGESGCGKTTLGRSLLRLIEPTSGRITFAGEDITHLPPTQLRQLRREMQMIFQDPYSALDSRMSIGNAVMEPLRIHRASASPRQWQERALYLLERVGLDATFWKRYPHQLSGGQCQRVCIARALALNPKFIICDESVSALDVSVQAQVLNLLRELQEEFQLTYIFISHDLSVVKFLSDRIMVMNHGQIEEIGPAETVFRQPTRPYTRRLIEATPKM